MKKIDQTANNPLKDGDEVKIVPQNKLYVIIPTIILLFSYMTLFTDVKVVTLLADEDCFFEMLTALAFFLAMILFILVYVRSLRAGRRMSDSTVRRCSYIVLALVMLLATGEEMSWGQRVLGVETPDYIKNVNIQDEINIHNLDLFQVTPERNVLRLLWHVFWFIFALGLPTIALLSSRGNCFLHRLVPVIPLSIGLLFLLNYLIWRIFYIELPAELYLNFPEEIMESNIAILFFVTALWVLIESPYCRKETSR